eukprot:508258_1
MKCSKCFLTSPIILPFNSVQNASIQREGRGLVINLKLSVSSCKNNYSMASQKHELLIATSIYTISCITSTIVTVSLYYSIYVNKNKKKLSDHLLYYGTYLISAISFTLGICNGTLRCYLSYLFHSNNLLQNKHINTYDNIFYFFGSNLFYIIVLLNLRNLFNNTMYALSKKTFIAIVIIITIQTVCSLWYTINEIISIEMLNQLPTFCVISFGLLLNIILMILFIIKLRDIISMHTDSNSMIDKIIKHLFLFGIAILFNIIFYIILICDKYILYNPLYIFVIRCIDQFSNLLALYFCFKFNQHIYYKICFKVHQFNRKCCMHNTNQINTSSNRNQMHNTNQMNFRNDTINIGVLKSNKFESIIGLNDEINNHQTRMKRILNNLNDTTSDEPSFDKLHCHDNDNTSSDESN